MHKIASNYSNSRFYRLAIGETSAYTEVFNTHSQIALVNPYLRLMDFLFPAQLYEHLQTEKKADFTQELYDKYTSESFWPEVINLLLHAYARLDRQKGLTWVDICLDILGRTIENGSYGEKIASFYGLQPRKRRAILLSCLLAYDRCGQRRIFFQDALCMAFKDISFYHEVSTNILHICINAPENEQNCAFFDLCVFFLWPCGSAWEIMWDGRHFGIIDWDETMHIGSLAIA